MASDFWIVLQWWGTLFFVGAVAYPLTKALFGRSKTGLNPVNPVNWWDEGYLFSKAVGMAIVTWIVFVLGTLHLMPFSVGSIAVALGVVFVLGIILEYRVSRDKYLGYWNNITFIRIAMIVFEELFFLIALFFWSWVKAHEPSIRGLEKFMDYGFMQSILNSTYFPPADMWYAGLPVNYYYFGHMVTAVLTKLSGLDLAVTFNLMLATIFALTLTMSFSIGYQLMDNKQKTISGGLLTAFLVTLAGNMQTIYAFTRGYTGDPPAGGAKPFWELLWGIRDIGDVGVFGVFWGFWGKIGEGMNTYWYANATRFIPYTIHEFPSYSFVVSDVHGHVLSIPFVLLVIGMLIQVLLFQGQALWYGFYGFLIGVLLMTNALDGPIYFALLGVVLVVMNWTYWSNWTNWRYATKSIGLVAGVALLTSLPFLVHFKSFVTGVAINCPPSFLANMKFGPILFEGVEKCQRSPLWMWWLLWGFFVYCGGGLIIKLVKLGKLDKLEKLLLTFFVFALVLVIVPEFIYFKDIYPMHFRSNTMFKLGYEAFILFSIVGGYFLSSYFFRVRTSRIMNHESGIMKGTRVLFLLFLIPQLILVSIYPLFSVRSYFGGLKRYEGIDGLGWIRREYPGDWEAIKWMNGQMSSPTSLKLRGATMTGLPVIVEADGDSYTDYARFSAFTGHPTIIGWSVHEWLWRGTYDVVAPRREEVRQIYESQDVGATSAILDKYGVRYVIVGKLEREKYKNLQEWKFFSRESGSRSAGELGREAFRSGGTIIYERK